MINSILLPESAALTELSVDFISRVVFPRLTLGQHGIFRRKRSQQVDVVRHHDKVSELITIGLNGAIRLLTEVW